MTSAESERDAGRASDAADTPAAATRELDVAAPYFEDLPGGLEYDAPGVTLTEGHAALYQSITGDRLRLPLDHAATRGVTGREAPLAHPLLALNLAIGQTTWASQRVKANLSYRGLHLERPVHLGDTLYTRTRVVGARRNRPQSGRAPTGVVALELTTVNQRNERVLHGWRFPMIPCRIDGAAGGAGPDAAGPDTAAGTSGDDLDAIGVAPTVDALIAALPRWNLTALRAGAPPAPAGTRLRIEARDTVTSAPELVRMTLNLAMAHTDAAHSHLGRRLVYGGHTIAIAFAQLTRALPDLLTVVAWRGCDHVAPVFEQDRLRTDVTVLARVSLAAGALLELRAETFAIRDDAEIRVLDWTLWAWTA